MEKLKHFFSSIWIWLKTHKKISIPGGILLLIGILVLLILGGYGPVDRTDSAGGGQETEEKLKLVPSPLTGVYVTEELANRPVTGLIIENLPVARPQSGLKEAGVVFEAIAEGGITRFLVMYQEGQPALIGPVRSLRAYYVDFAMGFDSTVAHVGGSPEALALVQTVAVKSLNQFFNSSFFERTSDRTAPHNVYTSSAKQDELLASKGYTKSEFTPLKRKADEPAPVPDAKSIDVDFSSADFTVHYDYDQTQNDYIRSNGGAAHVDREQGQIRSKVVVVLKANFSVGGDGRGSYGTLGTGEGFIFQDGTVKPITWRKDDRHTNYVFSDAQGNEVGLNAGQTWFCIIPNTKTVTYQ